MTAVDSFQAADQADQDAFCDVLGEVQIAATQAGQQMLTEPFVSRLIDEAPTPALAQTFMDLRDDFAQQSEDTLVIDLNEPPAAPEMTEERVRPFFDLMSYMTVSCTNTFPREADTASTSMLRSRMTRRPIRWFFAILSRSS